MSPGKWKSRELMISPEFWTKFGKPLRQAEMACPVAVSCTSLYSVDTLRVEMLGTQCVW